MVTQKRCLYQPYIYIYTYINPQTQSGDRSITQSYTLQELYTGRDCKYILSTLLNLSMGDKQNNVFIVSTQNNKENTTIHTHRHLRAGS